jgi:hypothetical protein
MKRAVILAAAVLVAAFCVFVWPTLYIYRASSPPYRVIRINRFTQSASGLTNTGWVPLTPAKPQPSELRTQAGVPAAPAPPPLLPPIPQELLPARQDVLVTLTPLSIESRLGVNYLNFEIHNKSPSTVKSVSVSIYVYDGRNWKRYRQNHRLRCDVAPGSWSKRSESIFDIPDDVSSGWDVAIEETFHNN